MKLTGTVRDGENNANIWLRRFADVYAGWLGQTIFPGSLNLDTGYPFDWHSADLASHRRRFSLIPHGGERDLFMVPCVIVKPGRQSGWFWTTTTAAEAREDPHIVELIASVNLRDRLGLSTGSRVEVEYPGEWDNPHQPQDVTNVALTTFDKSEAAIRAVRDAVFGIEQNVPRDIEWDGLDAQCIHVVATERGGKPIGTGRMLPDGRIGRLAVLKDFRGQGVGRKMLEALIESARARGLCEVYLHAQVQALPFYEKSGFQTSGAEFLEAGIRHVNMIRQISPAAKRNAYGSWK